MPPPDHCVCTVAPARLLWVIAMSSCMAVLLQILSSWLGLVAGMALVQAGLPAGGRPGFAIVLCNTLRSNLGWSSDSRANSPLTSFDLPPLMSIADRGATIRNGEPVAMSRAAIRPGRAQRLIQSADRRLALDAGLRQTGARARLEGSPLIGWRTRLPSPWRRALGNVAQRRFVVASRPCVGRQGATDACLRAILRQLLPVSAREAIQRR